MSQIAMKSKHEEVPADAQQLLAKRAERVKSASQNTTEDEAILWVAEFAIGEDTYAIPLSALRAAVPLRMVPPVPLSAPQVIGILRFQGQILTAMSLASLLGSRGWRQDPAVLLVVDPGWGQLTALDCEQIPKPSPLPMMLVEQARARGSNAILEITTRDMRQVNLIELARLLDRREETKRHGG